MHRILKALSRGLHPPPSLLRCTIYWFIICLCFGWSERLFASGNGASPPPALAGPTAQLGGGLSDGTISDATSVHSYGWLKLVSSDITDSSGISSPLVSSGRVISIEESSQIIGDATVSGGTLAFDNTSGMSLGSKIYFDYGFLALASPSQFSSVECGTAGSSSPLIANSTLTLGGDSSSHTRTLNLNSVTLNDSATIDANGTLSLNSGSHLTGDTYVAGGSLLLDSTSSVTSNIYFEYGFLKVAL